MRRSWLYVWTAVFVLLSNTWFCHVMTEWVSARDLFTFRQPASWESPLRALTALAMIPQLPSMIVSAAITNVFDLSVLGWGLTTSIVSILIYFPLIHFANRYRQRAN